MAKMEKIVMPVEVTGVNQAMKDVQSLAESFAKLEALPKDIRDISQSFADLHIKSQDALDVFLSFATMPHEKDRFSAVNKIINQRANAINEYIKVFDEANAKFDKSKLLDKYIDNYYSLYDKNSNLKNLKYGGVNTEIFEPITQNKTLERMGKFYEMQNRFYETMHSSYSGLLNAENWDKWTGLVEYGSNGRSANYSQNAKIASLFGEVEASGFEAGEKGTSSVDRWVTITGRLKQKLAGVVDSLSKVKTATDGVSKSAKKSDYFFNKFANRIKSIVSYRIIRGGLSKLTQYLQEGVQNLVKYEQALNGLAGTKATEVMTALSTSLQTLKNNLGAMAVAFLGSMQPAIQTFISWLNTAIDVINQFFVALQGGSMYKRATDAVYNYGTAVSSTAKKLQLLSFDELNVLNGDSGSNAGGTSYADMFEDADVSSKIKEFANEVKKLSSLLKPLIEWVKDNFETILDGALSIAGAIAGWKIATGLIGEIADITNKVGDLVGFANQNSVLEFAIVLVGATLFLEGINNAIKDGTDAIDLALIDIGATLAGVGVSLLAGVSVLTGGVVGLVVALVAEVALIIYESWDEITGFFSTIWLKIETGFISFINRCIDNLNKIVTFSNNVFGTTFQLLSKISMTGVGGTKGTDYWEKYYSGKYASGGTPDTGTLFWAGEAGAEVIGSVGGQTTVYNTDQLGYAMATANADVVQAINNLIGVVQRKSGSVSISASDIRKAVNSSNMRLGV